MTVQNCRPHGACMYCDAVPARPAVAPRIEESVVTGWDAGARSVTELSDADVHTVFQTGQAAGICIGFTTVNAFAQTDPSSILHGVYLWTQGRFLLWRVHESGIPIGRVDTRRADSVFEIRRIGDKVQYLVDGEVHTESSTPSAGDVIVGCCLYLTGDAVL